MSEIMLSEHFSLDEVTVTSNAALQASNRILTGEQLGKLRDLAKNPDPLQGMETAREICGGIPMRVHSAWRSDAVNESTKGASKTSQHAKGEAWDFDVPGQTVDETFDLLYKAAKAGNFKFGQLIIEEADRGYKNEDGTESISRWVHCSVVGTLNPDHVGQVMKAAWNEGEGKFDYTMVDRLSW